jgi:hypothetical protein
MISRRTILLGASCSLAIAIPTAYSKGRIFEGRKVNPTNYVGTDSVLTAFPIVFARTLVGGEPEALRVIASTRLLLVGASLISVAFDFAPKRELIESSPAEKKIQDSKGASLEAMLEQQGITNQDASD